MKFKLINPPSLPGERIIVPYGMAIVKNYLSKWHRVSQIDLSVDVKRYNKNRKFGKINLEVFYKYDKNKDFLFQNKKTIHNKEINNILKLCNIKKDTIICFSVHSYNQLIIALMMAKTIKQSKKNKIILSGSYFFNSDQSYFFNNFKFIDVIAVGFIDSIYSKIIASIKNGNRALVTGNTSSSKYIVPDYSDLNLSEYKVNVKGKMQLVLPLATSLECPGKCAFCNYYKCAITYNVDDIVRSIIFLKKKYNTSYFYFVNLSIDANLTQLYDLCKTLINKKINILWSSKSRPIQYNKELMTLMVASGCYELEFGLESASFTVLQKIKKPINIPVFEKMIWILSRKGVSIIINIIVGFPTETKNDFNETLKFISQNYQSIGLIHISRFTLFENSTIAKNPSKFKILIQNNRSFLDKVRSKLNFKYLNRVDPFQREKQAMKLYYKKYLQKRYHILKFIPFNVFKILFYDRLLFTNRLCKFGLLSYQLLTKKKRPMRVVTY